MQTEVSADLKKNQGELRKDLYHLIFFPYNHKKKSTKLKMIILFTSWQHHITGGSIKLKHTQLK
jgi:hypothetical protein